MNVMKPIKHVPADNDVDKLIKNMKSAGFGAKKLAQAVDILEEAIRDKETKLFIGVSGALIPAGMRLLLKDLTDWGDVFVVTGATLVHDLIEAVGERHYQGNELADDAELNKKGINRIYDVFLPNKGYEELEKWLHTIFDKIKEKYGDKKLSIKDFIYEIGKQVKDEESFLKAIVDKNIPIFCPGIEDSAIGFHYWSWMMKDSKNRLNIDTFEDIKDMMDLAWTSDRSSIFILGGGFPKDFIIQAMQFSPKDHSSGVQINMDREETGGLSGAKLKEGISWGKLGHNAKHVSITADITIVLPFIVASLKKRLK